MARNKVLLALDIIPGKIYMAKRLGSTWEPVMIETTDEPGYLRGHVLVENFRRQGSGYVANARVRFLESGQLEGVAVRRKGGTGDPWELADSNIIPTVIEMPQGWAKNEAANIEQIVDTYQRRLNFLRTIESRT